METWSFPLQWVEYMFAETGDFKAIWMNNEAFTTIKIPMYHVVCCVYDINDVLLCILTVLLLTLWPVWPVSSATPRRQVSLWAGRRRQE